MAPGTTPAGVDALDHPAVAVAFHSLLSHLLAHGLPQPRRVVHTTPPAQVALWEAAAAGTVLHPLATLLDFWEIDLQSAPAQWATVLALLDAIPEVQHIEERPTWTPPAPYRSDDTWSGSQAHLFAAPGGIDAEAIWLLPGGDGAGVKWIDIEEGVATHEDLPPTPLLVGVDRAANGWHGTGVIALVSGVDNAVGVIGIAPAAGFGGYLSVWQSSTTQASVADRVVKAIGLLDPGDVLLIEENTLTGYPVEVDDPTFHAIRLASALGRIVVEPAGNGTSKLDSDPLYPGLFDRAGGNWRDSGAIMVGAGFHGTRALVTGTHYGSRLDCWAQGAGVATAGWNGLTSGEPAHKAYAADFSHTSAASAIIAGAALCVQGRFRAITGNRLTPLQMRAVLPLGGTPPADPLSFPMGRMPNLGWLAKVSSMDISDVYVRDHVGDSGAVPSISAGTAECPDVFVLPTALPAATAAALFGEGGPFADTLPMGTRPTPGVDNYVYVRVRNGGISPAAGCVAHVAWGPLTTLAHPATRSPVGSSTPITVPPGDILTVLPAIRWPAATVPTAGTCGFHVVVESATDPLPFVPASTDAFIHAEWVASSNNVGWRQVVAPNTPGGKEYAFQIVSAPSGGASYDLRFRVNLPVLWKAKIALPAREAAAWAALAGVPVHPGPPGWAFLDVPGGLTIPGVSLLPSKPVPCGWHLSGLGTWRPMRLEVRQYFGGMPVGAISWFG